MRKRLCEILEPFEAVLRSFRPSYDQELVNIFNARTTGRGRDSWKEWGENGTTVEW